MRLKASGPLIGFGKPALAVLAIAVLAFSSFVALIQQPEQARAAATSAINFQARLMTSSGAIVPDGYYNVEFKLYNVSTGGSALWTDTYYDTNGTTAGNDNRIRVQNGYLTVGLGSQVGNGFPNTINWDQELWITMNIGGSTQTATPTWDGEMGPRLQLTAVPYAFQAAKASELQVLAGGNTATLSFAGSFAQNTTITLPDPGASTATVCYQNSTSCGFASSTSGNFIQNGTTVQTNANFNIRSAATGSVGAIVQGANGQTADLLQLQTYNGTTSSNVFAVSASGAVTLNGGQTLDVTTASAATANGMVLAPGVSTGASATGAALALRGGEVSGTTSVTGGAVTIQGGSATGASGTRNGGAVTVDGGTGATANGAVNIGTGNAPTINIGSVGTTAKATSVNIATTTTTTAGAIQSVTIGSNSNLAHTTVIQGGSGNTAGSEAIRIVPQTTGGVAIGSTTGTGTITLGQSTAANTINIGSANFTAANTQTVNISNGLQTTAASTLNVNILSNSGNGTSGTGRLNLANNDRVTQVDIGNVVADAARTLNVFTGNSTAVDTINIGTGATTAAGGKTINIGNGTPTGSGTNLITIGSTTNASTTTVQGGTGSGAVSIQAGTSGTISLGTTNANTVTIGSTNSSTATTIRGGGGVTIGDSASASNVTVNAGNGAGNLITLQSNNSTGGVKVKSTTNSTGAFLVQDAGTNNYLSVDTSGAVISVGYASSTTTLNGTVQVTTVGAATANSVALCRDTSTNNLTACNGSLATNAFVQGGNSFGATAVLGTNDANNLEFEVNGSTRATFDQSYNLYLGNGITSATPSGFRVAATGSSAAGTGGSGLTLQGGAGASATTGSTGGDVTVAGGNAGGSGNNAGGTVLLQGGSATGTGAAGIVLVKNLGNSTTAFQVQNAASTAIFSVDTAGSAANVAGTLNVAGVLNLTGSATTTFTTPSGGSVTTKINIPIFDPGDNNQIVSMGLPSGTVHATSRVMSLFDGRTTAHQPTLAVFSPDENNIVGLSWNGTNTLGLLMTTDSAGGNNTVAVGVRSGATTNGGNSGNVYLQSGEIAGGTGNTSGTIFILSGDAGGTNGSSGNVTIDSGVKTGSGTNGVINLGVTNSLGINVGRAAGTVTLQGGTTKLTTVGASTANAAALCRDTSTTNLVSCDVNTSGKPFLQGGNTFGATASLGTNDANNLEIKTNSVVRATFDQSNGLYLGLGVTNAAPTAFTVSGTGSSAAGANGGALTIQGGAGASATTGSAGGALNLNGGNAGGSGNNVGGNVTLGGGNGTGSGSKGGVVVKNAADSANAFRVQNAAGTTTVLGVDTTNSYVGIGTPAAAPARTLHVGVSNATTTTQTLLVEQSGTGDSGIEIKNVANSYYVGIDTSDSNRFKISSSSAAGTNITFGNPGINIGTASTDAGDINFQNASRFTSGVAGTLTSISVYIVGGSTSNQYSVALYSDAGSPSRPNTLMASSANTNIIPNSWNTVSVSASVAATTSYWLAFNTNDAGANMKYDGLGGTNNSCFIARTFASGWTNPFGGTCTLGNQNFGIYATYTTAATADNLNTSLFSMGATGDALFRNSTNSTAAFQVQNAAGTSLMTADTSTTTLTLGAAAGTTTLQGTVKVSTVGAATANAAALCRDSSTTNLISCDANTTGRPFLQGGNTFAATGVLGTNDANNMQIKTNNVIRATFDQSNNLYLGLGATAASPTAFTVAGTGSSTAGTAGALFTVKGGAGASATTGSAGGGLTLAGGDAAGSGNNNGGVVLLQGGGATGSGTAGGVLVKNTSNVSTAFQVQNASSVSQLTVNTTASTVTLVNSIIAGVSTDSSRFYVPWVTGDTLPTMYVGSSNTSNNRVAIRGVSYSDTAIWGSSNTATGVYGESTTNFGVVGSGAIAGVLGTATTGVGIQGESSGSYSGVFKSSSAANTAVTLAVQQNGASAANLLEVQDASLNPLFRVESDGDAFIRKDAMFFAGQNHTLGVQTQTASNTAGNNLTVSAATGNGTGAGGLVTVQGGTGGATGQGGGVTVQGGTAGGGNNNGGTVTINGGTGAGTGATGLVVINTPTFQTAATQNCATSCSITQANINGNGAVIINATAASLNITMGDPTITTAGRIVYVTAANGSNDFTLVVNGGGTGNQISMRQNTTATMIWNGSDWTAAGASSSTTLQAAYDNTLTSAGGAELVLSNTANANGLTIRDSSTNSVNGTLLEVQSSTAANLFSVNSNVTDYATDAGAEVAGGSSTTFPASTWSANGSASISRYTTAGSFVATGIASVQTTTTAAAGDGVKNTLSTALTANNHYNVSFTTRLTSGTFTNMDVYYSINGTATSVLCTSGKAVATSVWTKVNCTFTAPSSGITSTNAILIRQTTGAVRTFYVDNLSVTIAADFNLATDGTVADGVNFATNWSSAGLGSVTVTRNTSDGNDASDSAQVAVTTGAANAGARNKLAINPLQSTLYRVSIYTKLNSGAAFTDFKVRYSRDAGTNFVDCVDYNSQTVVTTGWTQITCYITTDGTAPSNPYIYFVETASAVRTYSLDTFSMTLAQNTTPNVQIGGGLNGGPVTLFTLDRGASAPIAANNDAMLGSMYYDTSLGKLQCYEADGWGACGSSPDNIVTISPEYTNAVLNGTGVGTMTSDVCSDQLNLNDGSSSQPTICGTNETYNFYKWTSPQASAQTYSIYVTYQLPGTFKGFSSGSTSIMGRTDSTNSTVQYTVYRNSASGLTQCGSTVAVSTGSVSAWQVGTASGAADPSTCGFSGGDSIVFKIDTIASVNANAYVGNMNFTFTNQ